MIGNSEQVQVPDDALVVDGQGKYLMPGLVDMSNVQKRAGVMVCGRWLADEQLQSTLDDLA